MLMFGALWQTDGIFRMKMCGYRILLSGYNDPYGGTYD